MQPGTLVAGKYRVERVIGRGGMGLVVEAIHLHLGTRVALKFLATEMAADPTAIARFRREAQASAHLKSEHICRVSDFGVDDGLPYIVMELLTGTDLARLSKVRVLDVSTAALYIAQACTGLAEAHAAGIIHRDLKPGNLFLIRRADGTPLVKVLDFGVAKAPTGENEVRLTGTSNVVGSPGFMSPEQFRSSKSVDARTDVWSLGVILYKLVSGRLPFKADNFAEFALAITRDEPPALPEVPPAFFAVIAKCLEKDPAKRYQDVGALGAALSRFASGARPSAQQMSVPDAPVDDPVSGIGGLDGPDSAMSTRVLGSAAPAPVARAAPAPAVATPTAASAKQTILGVATAADLKAPPAMQPSPTASSAAITGANPQPTVAGTAVGLGAPRYVPGGELPSGTHVGEYVIDKKIGEGGMGVVYSATHPLIGKRAAIKVIAVDLGADPVVVQRFVQEARSVNQIGHPNIVDVFAFGTLPDGRNYFVMEYLQGESLRARLSRTFLTIADAVQILDEIAGALEAAHGSQIVHRDLKPDNVFLSSVRGGFIHVKLLDFGIAKLVAGDGGVAKTSTGMIMGTPGYLSPEQARGRNVDHRTDIYALGVMMFEMITGRMPFMAESPMDIVLMHISSPPPRPSEFKPDIPLLLEKLLLEMLDKDPDRRPSLVRVREVFAELVASGLIQIEPGSAATFRSDLARRRGDNEGRTPPSQPRPLPAEAPRAPNAPIAPTILPESDGGRRRANSPSEAPTGISFDPAGAARTPASPRRSRRGLAITIVGVALMVPAVAIVIGLTSQHRTAPTGDAALASSTPPADAAPRIATDAATSQTLATVTADAPTVDAPTVDAPAQQRDVTITANVPTAIIEVDGAAVPTTSGRAKVALADGPHRLVVSAAGRITVEQAIDVSGSSGTIVVRLERKPRTTQVAPGTGSGAAPNGAGAGSGSAASKYGKDGTIDPFAP
ncbi:MAG: protein kinase [Myxococcales bacterium]|nr:protein kinase [Myxococcales bacterium]